jgi:hypothetical protein
VKEIPDRFLEEIGGGIHEQNAGMSGKEGRTNYTSTRSAGFASKTGTTGTGGDKAALSGKSPFDFGSFTSLKSGNSNASETGGDSYLRAGDLRIGEKVNHPKFGTGKILTILPVADDAILEIQFDDYGTKKLLTKQAKLTR